jgi:hypothetical protein
MISCTRPHPGPAQGPRPTRTSQWASTSMSHVARLVSNGRDDVLTLRSRPKPLTGGRSASPL